MDLGPSQSSTRRTDESGPSGLIAPLPYHTTTAASSRNVHLSTTEEQERLSEASISAITRATWSRRRSMRERSRSLRLRARSLAGSSTSDDSPRPTSPSRDAKNAIFDYEPLDSTKVEIRLLELIPSASREQQIVCNLLQTPLGQAPSFEALSYTWGEKFENEPWSAQARQICIRGCIVNIQENLFRALTRLRKLSQSRLLWVDALCINQQDETERGDQVSKMGAIYTTAANVVSWLGEGSVGTSYAFSLIDNVAKNIENDKAIREIIRPSHAPARAQALFALSSLTEMFRRDYWSRVWVIQEVHFARSVIIQCGEYTIPWVRMVHVQNTLVVRFMDLLGEFPEDSDEDTKQLKYVRHAMQFRGPRSLVLDREIFCRGPAQIDLFEGLLMHRLKKATDSRDKIYALVGLTKAAKDPDFVIDYTLPMRQVFINTVDYVLQKSASLDIILIQTKGVADVEDFEEDRPLPTWTPHFGARSSCNPIPFRHATLDSAYGASALIKAEAKIDLTRGNLTTRGVIIASVGSIAPSQEAHYANDLDSGISAVKSWKAYVRDKFEHSTKLLELARLLLCELPESLDSVPDSELLGIFDLFDQDLWSEAQDRDEIEITIEPKRSAAENIDRLEVQTIVYNIYRRNLFITENGDLGMAQDSVLEGDLVCIIFGCSIPVILRRVDEHFIYISDACVVGYMYGKGIQEVEGGKLETETFEIH